MATHKCPPLEILTLENAQQFLLYCKSFAQNDENGFSNVCYVDPDGDDATAKRGSWSRKFFTIAAALTKAQSGDTIWLGPGTYLEKVVIPPALDDLVIRGLDEENTLIQAAGLGDVITYAPTTPKTRIKFEKLRVFASNGSAIVVDASQSPGLSVVMVNVLAQTTSLVFAAVAVTGCALALDGCTGLAPTGIPALSANQCFGGEIVNSNLTNLSVANQDPGGVLTLLLALRSSVVRGDMIVIGAVILEVDRDSVVLGSVTATLEFIVAAVTPYLGLHGTFGNEATLVGGAVMVTSPDPAVAKQVFVNMADAIVYGDIDLATAGAGVNIQNVVAPGLKYLSPMGDVTVGSRVTFDARGADRLEEAAVILVVADASSSFDRDGGSFKVSFGGPAVAQTLPPVLALKRFPAGALVIWTVCQHKVGVTVAIPSNIGPIIRTDTISGAVTSLVFDVQAASEDSAFDVEYIRAGIT